MNKVILIIVKTIVNLYNYIKINLIYTADMFINKNLQNITSFEKGLLKKEFNKTLLAPIKIISIIVILSGLFALIFEVKYYKDVSIFVYAFRFLAIAAAFWVLIISSLDIGKKYPSVLAHLLLISIIISFAAVIIFVPNTLVVNSQITALIIFTSAMFLSWNIKHQIVVAIYYNLVFGATLLINKDGIFFVDNIFAAVVFVMFLSVLSIVAVFINTKLRMDSILNNIRFNDTQRRFKEIFENAPDGLFQSTLSGEIIAANKSFYKLFEIDNLFEKIYLNNNSILDQKEFLFITNTLMHNNYLENYQLKINVGNRTKVVQINCKMRQDYSLGTYVMEGTLRDVTDQFKAEEELKRAKEKAEESDKLKSEFLSQMSHEIRTPINAILSSVDFLHEELQNKYDDEIKTTFDIIHSASNRIIRTIHLILNLAEIQSGLYNLKASKFDLYIDCLLLIQREYENAARKKNIELKLNKWTDNSQIIADEFSINQIFRNLIDNSIKYTHSGSVEVDIDRDENGRLTVEIIDTGIGISSDYIPYMFKTFSQEEQGFTRKFDGNGLGLALVKKYCELNNAVINIKSKKNEGTTVKITFFTTRSIMEPVISS